LKNRTRFR
jgi:hypothetical protein